MRDCLTRPTQSIPISIVDAHRSMHVVLGGDVCAIPDGVIGALPRSMMVRALPLGMGETCLVTTGPMIVLHETSTALPRATTRIPAIQTIFLATSIHCCRVILGRWPELRRRRVPQGTRYIRLVVSVPVVNRFRRNCMCCFCMNRSELRAIPDRVMRVHPMPMVV